MKQIFLRNGKVLIADEQWITIGGEDNDGSGHHVLIKENGTIVAGFGKGRNVKNAFGGSQKASGNKHENKDELKTKWHKSIIDNDERESKLNKKMDLKVESYKINDLVYEILNDPRPGDFRMEKSKKNRIKAIQNGKAYFLKELGKNSLKNSKVTFSDYSPLGTSIKAYGRVVVETNSKEDEEILKSMGYKLRKGKWEKRYVTTGGKLDPNYT